MLLYLPIALTALATTLYHIALRPLHQTTELGDLCRGTVDRGVELAMLMCLGGLVLIARP